MFANRRQLLCSSSGEVNKSCYIVDKYYAWKKSFALWVHNLSVCEWFYAETNK